MRRAHPDLYRASDPMRQDLLDSLLKARAAGRPVVLATLLPTGAQRLLEADEEQAAFAGRDIASDAKAAMVADSPRVLDTPQGEVFLNVFNPPLKLVLIGAVHISQALAPIAQGAGYHVTVVDPRGAFTTTERFPGVRLIEDWPDDHLDSEPPDSRTAIVTLTHDPKLDDAALGRALTSPAFYIGALGSRKTHATRVERLCKAGFDEAALAHLHAPVGLAIGAQSPAEIAISIMAEITQVLRQGNAIRTEAAR